MSDQSTGQLAGQRAFITGGASGIGAEMARRFTREGASVVIADVNDTLGKAIAVEVGGEYVHLDVTDSTAWDKIMPTYKPFDIVCLNAGVSTNSNVFGAITNYPFEYLDNDSYQKIMSINVDGVVFGARAVIPGMVERKSGHILVTASLAGIVAIAADPIYGLTKHAMVGLAKSLGGALEPHGVCVSALCPAFLYSLKKHVRISIRLALASWKCLLQVTSQCVHLPSASLVRSGLSWTARQLPNTFLQRHLPK
jgi:NAD(P)-dependent dehydrogenase (short-subunit alcohol dehydrogenase family)